MYSFDAFPSGAYAGCDAPAEAVKNFEIREGERGFEANFLVQASSSTTSLTKPPTPFETSRKPTEQPWIRAGGCEGRCK